MSFMPLCYTSVTVVASLFSKALSMPTITIHMYGGVDSARALYKRLTAEGLNEKLSGLGGGWVSFDLSPDPVVVAKGKSPCLGTSVQNSEDC
jgi:hypothetical protein